MTNVLEGVRVLEVALYAFVPTAGAVLADWGADVVKVEHAQNGDPMRGNTAWGVPSINGFTYLWELSNRGKRGIVVDIAHPAGREIILRLAERADVFLTNFMPDARRRLGIDVDDITARNPGIVYAVGSAQGQQGPDADKGGFDGISYWSRAGVAASLRPSGATWPSEMPGPGFGDVQSGMALAGGISAALFHRERTGRGVVVDTSLFGAGLWAMQPTILAAHLVGTDVLPYPDREHPTNPVANMYATADGRHIMLAMLQSDRYWSGLCDALDRPELALDERFSNAQARESNAAECAHILSDIFATRTLSEWSDRLGRQEGQWDAVKLPGEAASDPQAIENGYVVEVDYGDGRSIPLVTPPAQFDGVVPKLRPAPEHGEHTEEVLQELGMDWDQIIEHKLTGAVK